MVVGMNPSTPQPDSPRYSHAEEWANSLTHGLGLLLAITGLWPWLGRTVARIPAPLAQAMLAGVPVPAMSASLAFFDAFRSARLPADLLQAQRDFFGAHTYERIDKPGKFHTLWSGDRSEIEA